MDLEALKIQTGKTLASIRKEANLTQEDFIELSTVSSETISRVENGKSDPQLSTLYKMTRALNISIAELFYASELLEPNDTEIVEKIVKILRNMDTTNQKFFLQYLENFINFEKNKI